MDGVGADVDVVTPAVEIRLRGFEERFYFVELGTHGAEVDGQDFVGDFMEATILILKGGAEAAKSCTIRWKLDGQSWAVVVHKQRRTALARKVERDAVTSRLASSKLILPESPKRLTLKNFFARMLATGAAAILVMAAGAQGRTRSQEKQPLGSLSSAGEVYVNNSPAPADATIFTGDTIRTGATGTATFTSSVEGTIQVLPGSQIAFNGGDQYLAELQAGAVVVSSQRGPQGLSVRAGSYTVVGAAEGELTSAKIERGADGSFAVTCLGGSVILVPAGEGTSGLLIQAGQTVNISAKGKLSSVREAAVAPAPSATPAPGEAPSTPAPAPVSTGISNTTKWIIAGVAIAGGAGAALALAGGHKSSSVSPSNP